MPLPKPKDDEKKSEFIERFMSNKRMIKEYPRDQRYAIALSQWRKK